MNKTRNNQYWLFFAFTLAVLLRVGLLVVGFTHPDRVLETDSGSYLTPAQYMLQDGYYSYPSSMRMPLYPAFLALIMKVFGSSLLPVIIVQVLLGLGTVVLAWRTGLLLGLGPRPSAIGAVLLSLSLESLFSPFFILTDTLFTFLLIAATYALVRFIKLGGWTWLVSASLLNGLVMLCRPVLAFASIGIVILLLFNDRARFIKRIVHAVIFTVLLIGLFVAPWTYRNAQVTGVKVITTELDLYWIWGAATVNANIEGIPVEQAMVDLDHTVNQTLAERGLEPNEYNVYYVRSETGKRVILNHPGEFVIQTLRYDLRNFLPGMGYAVNYLGFSRGSTEGLELLQASGLQGILQNYFGGSVLSSLIFLPFLLLLGLTYLGALVGVIVLFRKRDWLSLAVLLLPIGYFFLVPGYSANSRYRIPAMPFIALLAGVGLVVVWQFLAPRLARKQKQVK